MYSSFKCANWLLYSPKKDLKKENYFKIDPSSSLQPNSLKSERSPNSIIQPTFIIPCIVFYPFEEEKSNQIQLWKNSIANQTNATAIQYMLWKPTAKPNKKIIFTNTLFIQEKKHTSEQIIWNIYIYRYKNI